MVNLLDQPVILLAGTEKFLKQEKLSKVKSKFLDKGSSDFNFNVFYAGITSAEKVLECAYTVPFLGRKRVVVVYQFDQFSVKDKKFILSYVKNPHKQTLLILETEQTNFKYGGLSEISQYAQVVLCNPVGTRECSSWVRKQLKLKDKEIEDKALDLLIDNVGDDLSVLANYIESITLYTDQRKTIALTDVEKLTGPNVHADVFKLFDALMTKDKFQSLAILDSLLKEGASSAQILGALTYKVVAEKNRLRAALFSSYLKRLQRADSDIKTGRQNQRLALELLVVRLLTLL